MKASREHKSKIRLTLILAALVIAYGCYGLYHDTFRYLDTQIIDRLYIWRAKINPAPSRNIDFVVHVDANSYFGRSQHAKVISNLAAMDASVQLIDFLFTDVTSPDEDIRVAQLLQAFLGPGCQFLDYLNCVHLSCDLGTDRGLIA